MILSKDDFWFSFLKVARRTQTIRLMTLSVVLISIYYAVLYVTHEYFFDFDFKIPDFIIYSLGYVIAILFYFRLGNSYYRWFDGLKSLASLRSNSDSFSIKVSTYLKDHRPEVKFLVILMKDYYRSVRDIVRGFQNPKAMIEPEIGFVRHFVGNYHLPSKINSLLEERLNTLYKEGKLTKPQFWDINRCIVKNSEHLSACEALKGTPPPPTYIMHIRGFILLYALMIPFGFIHEFQAWMLLFLVVFFYFYAGLEIVSDQIEDPFGLDKDDLPIEEMTLDTERRARQIVNT
jgi:ion channel-forming bestrophin family protein